MGGNSLSDLLVFGKRAGEYAAQFAKANQRVAIDAAQIDAASRDALAPFDSGRRENPYAIQHELQDIMQRLVGIVRQEDEMLNALGNIERLWARANAAGVSEQREYNPGWHTALDLRHLLTVSEAITRCALERKESRGGHFREDYPEKAAEFGKINMVVRKADDGAMDLRRIPLPEMPAELKQVIEENK